MSSLPDKPIRRKAAPKTLINSQANMMANPSAIEQLNVPQLLYSLQSEKAVLGCMLSKPLEVIDEVSMAITRDDFFVPAHQEVFSVLREMFDAQRPIEPLTVHQFLVDRSWIKPWAVPAFWASCSPFLPPT